MDRYGEVDAIAEKWEKALLNLDYQTAVVMNADDPQLSRIGKKIHTQNLYFGLDNPSYYLPRVQHATDSIYCPICGEKLVFQGMYYSHLGDWACTKFGFSKPKLNLSSKDVKAPLEGVYNIYNTLAATLVGKTLHLGKDQIKKSIVEFQPAFGRLEEITYKGKTVKILLSKNPTGFNESLRTVLQSKTKGPMMLVLNDRIPDGTDVSWIWDVDFELLDNYHYPLIISGGRALDMGLRIKYGVTSYDLRVTNEMIFIIEKLKDAVEIAVEKTKENETLWVLATYSAMLEVRKILTGKRIL